METIEDIYYAFGKNFLFASVMFLPDILLDLVDGETKEGLRDMINEIYIIERGGENYLLEGKGKFCSIHVLSKKTLLDDNVFMLLRFREEQSIERFGYILKRYMEQLGGYKYFSQWLYENLDKYISDPTEDAINAFELQYDTFVRHQNEVKEQFLSKEEKVNLPDLMSEREKSASQLGSMIENRELNKLLQELPKKQDGQTNKKNRREKFKAEIEGSADKLILENVFNLKLDSNNIKA